MKRKQAKEVLSSIGVYNKFSLRTVSFSDLVRARKQFVTIRDWTPDPRADEVKEAFRPYGVIVGFD